MKPGIIHKRDQQYNNTAKTIQSNLVRKSLFTTTHMAGTDSVVSVLNVLVTTTTCLVITAHFSGTKGAVINKFDCTSVHYSLSLISIIHTISCLDFSDRVIL